MKLHVLAAVLFVALLAGGAAAQSAAERGLVVMTQNLYFGADILALGGIDDPGQFLAAARATLLAVAATDYPERARAVAREIAERRPDVVALQEVYDLQLNSRNAAVPFVDYLQVLLSALDAEGAPYAKVASVRNLNVTLPIDVDGDRTPESMVTVIDRDVILARKELVDAGLVVAVPLSAFCNRPSADGGPGCNYQVRAEAATPFGQLAVERGVVAADVVINGRPQRVVNTHLEVRAPDPNRPESAFIQAAQAAELKGLLDALTPPDLELIVVGDFNSDPRDTAEFAVSPYQQLAAGLDLFGQPGGPPYLDAWLLRPGTPPGNTCCQAEDLRNRWSTLDQRVDLVFSRERPASVKATLVGNERPRPASLWPSDHAGVLVRFFF